MSAPSPSTKLTIVRSQWDRGHVGGVYLRHPDHGKMCCLGFDAKRRGYTDEQITGVKTPGALLDAGLPDKGYIAEGWLMHRGGAWATSHNPDCSIVMMANDKEWESKDPDDMSEPVKFSESRREEYVAAFFARYGIEVEFVD